jgi:hypothetical protein
VPCAMDLDPIPDPNRIPIATSKCIGPDRRMGLDRSILGNGCQKRCCQAGPNSGPTWPVRCKQALG